jgi:hypothetical protein
VTVWPYCLSESQALVSQLAASRYAFAGARRPCKRCEQFDVRATHNENATHEFNRLNRYEIMSLRSSRVNKGLSFAHARRLGENSHYRAGDTVAPEQGRVSR